jgi:hypothetical protein
MATHLRSSYATRATKHEQRLGITFTKLHLSVRYATILLHTRKESEMAKSKNPLDSLVTGRGHYVLNQKSAKFADRRTRRNRDRSAQRRNAIADCA